MTKAHDTRSGLLAAAQQIVLANGPDRLTLDAVALEAGVSKGGVLYLVSTECLGEKKLRAEAKALVSVGVDPLGDEFRQDGVAVGIQEKMWEGVSERQRGDHF